jgi:hypothetical protein
MLHHHLHFFANLGRHAVHLYHHASRVLDVGLLRLQRLPRHVSRPKISSARLPKKLCGSKKPLLIHYHIFKNAGTSFEWTLQQALGTRVHTYDSPAPYGILSPDDIINYVASMPEAEAIFSHQAVFPAPKIRSREIFTSILIRDPIARIRSIYAFEHRQGGSTPGSLKARELDFKGYVEWRLSTAPAALCNYQVHFCSRTWSTRSDEKMGEIHLQEAIANLDRVNIVGTVERYCEWLALAQAILSKAFPKISLSVTRQNVTGAGTPITEAAILDDLVKDLGQTLAEHLLQRNELDMCLHQVADALLTRRLAEEGVGIALLKAYAEARARFPRKSDSDPAEGG